MPDASCWWADDWKVLKSGIHGELWNEEYVIWRWRPFILTSPELRRIRHIQRLLNISLFENVCYNADIQQMRTRLGNAWFNHYLNKLSITIKAMPSIRLSWRQENILSIQSAVYRCSPSRLPQCRQNTTVSPGAGSKAINSWRRCKSNNDIGDEFWDEDKATVF